MKSDDYFGVVTSGSPASDVTLRSFQFDNNATLYVVKDTTEADIDSLKARFETKVVEKRNAEVSSARIGNLAVALGRAMIPNLFLLALGSALVWALSGFRARSA